MRLYRREINIKRYDLQNLMVIAVVLFATFFTLRHEQLHRFLGPLNTLLEGTDGQ